MNLDTAHIKAVILDLDGVIYRGRTALPGAKETTAWLHRQGYQIYYFTNNSSLTRHNYVELLAGFSIVTDTDHVITSASLTSRYFHDIGALDGRTRPTVLVVGEGGLAAELRAAGVRVVRRRGQRPIDYVVVGMDRGFTYRKLYEAQQAVRGGAGLIATNRDATYPVEDENVIPGGGSIVAAIATAAEREPLLIGKPSPRAGELVIGHIGIRADQTLVVGDRLETDIEMGRGAGMWTCLVLSGVSQASQAEGLPPERRPHFVVAGIWKLPELLAGGPVAGIPQGGEPR